MVRVVATRLGRGVRHQKLLTVKAAKSLARDVKIREFADKGRKEAEEKVVHFAKQWVTPR